MATTLVNGKSYSFVDVVLVVAGVPVFGVTAINYEETQEKTNNYGASTRAVSRGRGKKESSASITLSMNEVEALRDAAPEGSLLNIDPFDVQITYVNPQKVVTHVLKNCEFINDGVDISEGDTDAGKQFDLVLSHVKYR